MIMKLYDFLKNNHISTKSHVRIKLTFYFLLVCFCYSRQSLLACFMNNK